MWTNASPILQLLVSYQHERGEEVMRLQSVHSLADKWNKDLTVHSLNLPEHMCCHLLGALARSTASLPKSLRHLDDFYVS